MEPLIFPRHSQNNSYVDQTKNGKVACIGGTEERDRRPDAIPLSSRLRFECFTENQQVSGAVPSRARAAQLAKKFAAFAHICIAIARIAVPAETYGGRRAKPVISFLLSVLWLVWASSGLRCIRVYQRETTARVSPLSSRAGIGSKRPPSISRYYIIFAKCPHP
jgi:hypothetical protein